MLKIGGIINIIIAIAHIIGLIWAEQMFDITGIGKEMNELSEVNSILPYLLTILTAIVFFIFGLYGLSADDKFRSLPFLKFGIFAIGGIYIFRGLGEITVHYFQNTNTKSETISSLIAIILGLLYLVGGLKKWKWKNE